MHIFDLKGSTFTLIEVNNQSVIVVLVLDGFS